ncbi:hypothetical protein QUF90_15940 [Desulfococcaceae bacterium HSG9]|nr:hypothetical protein [Desulfococcaceae bacterium HSG9]
MRLRGDGLYAAFLTKIIAYILAIRLIRLKITEKACSEMSLTQIIRKIRRDCDLEAILRERFHLRFSTA